MAVPVKVVRNAAFFFLLSSMSLVYFPSFWVHILALVDFYTPWVLFESKLYDNYHQFLVNRLPERPELPLQEITASEANLDYIKKISKGFTWPIVIRGLLGNESTSEAIRSWDNPKWWIDRYADEELLCGTLSDVVENCTTAAFFQEIENGKPFYISGASVIFERHPELHDMIDNEQIRSIEPGTRTATQVFMGIPQMGSDIHAAMGINMLLERRNGGSFLPVKLVGGLTLLVIVLTMLITFVDSKAYLKPSINVNGFSAHTHTLVGKEGGQQSPWMNKIERYTSVLHPGDVLINPPWFWHGIINLGNREDKKLIIGCPSRYRLMKPAFTNNPLFWLNGVLTIVRNNGLKAFTNRVVNLQGDIANNRRNREKKPLATITTTEE